MPVTAVDKGLQQRAVGFAQERLNALGGRAIDRVEPVLHRGIQRLMSVGTISDVQHQALGKHPDDIRLEEAHLPRELLPVHRHLLHRLPQVALDG